VVEHLFFSQDEIEKVRRMMLTGELLCAADSRWTKPAAMPRAEFYAQYPRFAETYLRQLGQVTPERITGRSQEIPAP